MSFKSSYIKIIKKYSNFKIKKTNIVCLKSGKQHNQNRFYLIKNKNINKKLLLLKEKLLQQ